MVAAGPIRVCACLAACIAALAAQAPLTPEAILLGRIRSHVTQSLAALPNYTCTQTIERSQRPAGSRRFRASDTVRVEVALIHGKELFAWPGESKFGEKDLTEMIRTGARGTGSFALHAYNIFASRRPKLSYAGEETREGRRLIRCDYKMSQLESGYILGTPAAQAQVGFHGAFWVDAATLDLVRLEVAADDIPPEIKITGSHEVVEFGRIRIGEEYYVLPSYSELLLTYGAGDSSLNRTRFSGCRQYGAQSVISFGEAPAGGTASPTPPTEVRLPPGLTVDLILQTPISGARSAIGDQVTAKVFTDVKKDGVVVVPKGAVAAGRITGLARRPPPGEYFQLELEFLSLEFAGKRAQFVARIEAVQSPTGGSTRPTGSMRVPYVPGRAMLALPTGGQELGKALLLVTGDTLELRQGLRFLWTTEAVPRGSER